MEVQCIAYYPGNLATNEGNSIRRMMHHAVPLNSFVTVLYIPPSVSTTTLLTTSPPALTSLHSQGSSNHGNTVHTVGKSKYQGIYTPQSFPPSPSSRKAVILRGYSYTEDLLYRVRDELRSSLGGGGGESIQQQEQQQQQYGESLSQPFIREPPSSYRPSILANYSSSAYTSENIPSSNAMNIHNNDILPHDEDNDDEDTAQTPRTDYYARTPSLPSNSRPSIFLSVPTTAPSLSSTSASRNRTRSSDNYSYNHTSTSTTSTASSDSKKQHNTTTDTLPPPPMMLENQYTNLNSQPVTSSGHQQIVDQPSLSQQIYEEEVNPRIGEDFQLPNDNNNPLQEYFNFFAVALATMTPSQLENFSRQLGLNDATVNNDSSSTANDANSTTINSTMDKYPPSSDAPMNPYASYSSNGMPPEFTSLPSLNDDNHSYSSYPNIPVPADEYSKSVASRNSSELVFSFHNIHKNNRRNNNDAISQDNQSRRSLRTQDTDHYDDDDDDFDDDSITTGTGSQSLSTPRIKPRKRNNNNTVSSSSSSTTSSIRTNNKPLSGLYFHGPYGSVVRVAGPAGLTGFTPARAQEIIDKLIQKQKHPHQYHNNTYSNQETKRNSSSSNELKHDNQSVRTTESSVPVRIHLSSNQANIDAVAVYKAQSMTNDIQLNRDHKNRHNNYDEQFSQTNDDNLSRKHDDYDALDQSDMYYSSSFTTSPNSSMLDQEDDDNLSAYWYSGTGSQSNRRLSSNPNAFYSRESKQRSTRNSNSHRSHLHNHQHHRQADNVSDPLDKSMRPMVGDNMSLPSNAIVNSVPSPSIEANAWPAEDAPPPPLSPRTAYSAAIAEAQAAADEAEQRKRQEQETNTGPRVFTQTHLFKHSFLYPRTREAKVETVTTDENEESNRTNSTTTMTKLTRSNVPNNSSSTVRFLLPTVSETPETTPNFATSTGITDQRSSITMVSKSVTTTVLNNNDNNNNTDIAYDTKTPFAGAEIYEVIRRNMTTNTTEEEKKELIYDTINPSMDTNNPNALSGRQKQSSPDTVDPQWAVDATLSTLTPLGPDGIFVPASTTVTSGGLPRGLQSNTNHVRSISSIPADYLLRSSTNSKTEGTEKYTQRNTSTNNTGTGTNPDLSIIVPQPTANAPPLRALARMAVFPIEQVHNDLLLCCGGHGILYPSKEATKNDPFAEYELKHHDESIGYAFYGGGKRRGLWNWSLSSSSQGTLGSSSVPGSVTGLGIACNRSGYRSARGGLAIPHYRPRDRTLCYFEFSVEAEEAGPFSAIYRSSMTNNTGTLVTNNNNPVFVCVGLAARSVPLEGPLGTLPLSVSLASSGHLVCGGQWTLLQSGTSFPSSYYHKNSSHNNGFPSSYTVGDTVGILVRWLGTGGPWAPEISDNLSTTIHSPNNTLNPPFDALQLTFSVNGRVVGVSGVISVPRGTELYPTIALGTPGIRILGGFSAADVKHGQRQTMVIAQAEPGTLPLHYYNSQHSNDHLASVVSSPVSSSSSFLSFSPTGSHSQHFDHNQAYGSLASSTYLAGTSGYAVFALDGSMLLPHHTDSVLPLNSLKI